MRFLTKFLSKRKIQSQWAQVVSAHTLNQLFELQPPVETQGILTEISFLTCHAQFSPQGDHSITAQSTILALQNFYYCMKQLVLANHGTVNSVNDGVVSAFWNAPVANSDHRQLAASCAIQMTKCVTDLNRTCKPHDLELDLIVVFTTAPSVVGNTELAHGMRYTCVGKAVCDAKTLYNQAGRYKVSTLACSDTVKHLDHTWVTVELDQSAQLYAVLDQYPHMTTPDHIKIARATHCKFLQAYREERYDMAIKIANSLKSAWNHKLKDYYTMMIDHCELLRSQQGHTI